MLKIFVIAISLVANIYVSTSLSVDANIYIKPSQNIQHTSPDDLILDYDFAVDLASLPLQCYNQEYPYKDAITLESGNDLKL